MEKRWSFRKVLSSVAVAGMLTSMVAVPAVSPVNAINDQIYDKVKMVDGELIVDGDFEAGGTAWTEGRQKSIATGISYGDGTKSGKLPENNGNSYIGQIFGVKPNTNYTVRAFVKTGSDDANVNFCVRTGTQNQLKGNSGTVAFDVKAGGAEWSEVSKTFNSGDNSYAMVQLVKWVEDTSLSAYTNAAYIDNVSIVEEGYIPETYEQIWRDDFDEEQLDTKDWGYELGCIRGVEQQHYVNSDKNVFTRDGNLVLKITDRAKEDQYNHPRQNNKKVIYDSGSVRTHGKREFLYGKIEMRAKLPKGKGVFPAFWTLGSDFVLDGDVASDQGYGWARCGEIDIMELVGQGNDGWGDKTVYQTAHTDGGNGGANYVKLAGTNYTISNVFNDDYHTFGINWSPNKLEWLVDGKVVSSASYDNNTIAKNALNRPQYIQLNLATGGAWFDGMYGSVDPNLAGSEYEIDWVSYSQTEAQKEAAEVYYKDAPKLSGYKDVTFVEGEAIDLLSEVSSTNDSYVDFSVEDGLSFKANPDRTDDRTDDDDGCTYVDLLCTGKNDVAALNKLPAGKYNLHYTAIPNDMKLNNGTPEGSETYKFDRKTVTLTVAERTFPSDFKLNGIVGDKLANVALPEGWSWVDPEAKITGTADEYDVKYVNGEYSKTVKVVVNAVVVDKDGLKDRLAEAVAEAAKTDVYKVATIEKLNTAIKEATKVLNDTSANKEAVEEAIRALNTAIANLEKYVTEVELNQVIAKGDELVGKTGVYTKESLDILTNALAKVRSAIDSGDKEAIEVAYVQLNEAIDKLVKIEILTPEKPVESTPEVKPSTSVKTGDDVYLGMIMVTLLLSAGGLTLLKRRDN